MSDIFNDFYKNLHNLSEPSSSIKFSEEEIKGLIMSSYRKSKKNIVDFGKEKFNMSDNDFQDTSNVPMFFLESLLNEIQKREKTSDLQVLEDALNDMQDNEEYASYFASLPTKTDGVIFNLEEFENLAEDECTASNGKNKMQISEIIKNRFDILSCHELVHAKVQDKTSKTKQGICNGLQDVAVNLSDDENTSEFWFEVNDSIVHTIARLINRCSKNKNLSIDEALCDIVKKSPNTSKYNSLSLLICAKYGDEFIQNFFNMQNTEAKKYLQEIVKYIPCDIESAFTKLYGDVHAMKNKSKLQKLALEHCSIKGKNIE